MAKRGINLRGFRQLMRELKRLERQAKRTERAIRQQNPQIMTDVDMGLMPPRPTNVGRQQ